MGHKLDELEFIPYDYLPMAAIIDPVKLKRPASNISLREPCNPTSKTKRAVSPVRFNTQSPVPSSPRSVVINRSDTHVSLIGSPANPRSGSPRRGRRGPSPIRSNSSEFGNSPSTGGLPPRRVRSQSPTRRSFSPGTSNRMVRINATDIRPSSTELSSPIQPDMFRPGSPTRSARSMRDARSVSPTHTSLRGNSSIRNGEDLLDDEMRLYAQARRSSMDSDINEEASPTSTTFSDNNYSVSRYIHYEPIRVIGSPYIRGEGILSPRFNEGDSGTSPQYTSAKPQSDNPLGSSKKIEPTLRLIFLIRRLYPKLSKRE